MSSTAADPPPDNRKNNPSWVMIAAVVVIAGIVAAGVLTAQPNAQELAEGEALRALRWIRQGQTRYVEDHGQPAATAGELAAGEKYLSTAHAALFTGSPGETASALPTGTGYVFRLLPAGPPPPEGTGKSPVWGVIARPIDPPPTGAHQFLMTQQGKVYRHAEPPVGDPQRGRFLLETMPPVTDEYGHVPDEKLAALGWTFAKQW